MADFTGNASVQKKFIPYSNFERNEPDAAKEIYKRLPRQMLCTNNLNMGLHTEAKTTGVRQRYIQVNHPNLTKIMVFDVDQNVYLYDWKYLNIPVPNILVINPKNSHCHMIYLLADTNYVCRTEKGRMNDIIAYETIYSSICTQLNADSRYVQKIMKNPFHNSWNTKVLHEDTYSLEDLAQNLNISLRKIKKSSASIQSKTSLQRQQEGRNCSLFERTRYFAYAAIKEHNNGATQKDVENFTSAVENYAATLNDGFTTPLGKSEVKATVKSITTWTLNHFAINEQNKEIQNEQKKDLWGDKSRENSLKKRAETKLNNIQKTAELKEQGKTIQEIMKILNRSKRMIEYYIAEYKKIIKENPEKKEELKELKEILATIIQVQFVISDISALIDLLSYLYIVLLLLDTS